MFSPKILQQSSAAAAAAASFEERSAALNDVDVPSAVFAPPKLLLIFDHRSLFDVTDADFLEMEAWQEALGAFGVEEISRTTYLETISQRSEAEVMMNMCPFTTKMEWPSILNKKRQKITHELKEWCFANAVAIPGAPEFIAACTKECEEQQQISSSSSSCGRRTEVVGAAGGQQQDGEKKKDDDDDDSPRTNNNNNNNNNNNARKEGGCIALWLSPWSLADSNTVLELAHLKSHAAAAQQVASSSEYCFVDLLELFGLRPPVETPESIAALAKQRNQPVDKVQAGRALLRKVFSSTANEKAALLEQQQQQQQSAAAVSRVVVFTGSSRVARIATRSGLTVVGVSYNCYDQEADEKILLDGCDDEAALLAAGCRAVLPNFRRMAPQYLRLL